MQLQRSTRFRPSLACASALALLFASPSSLAQTGCANNIVRAGDADSYLNTTSHLDVVSMRPAFEAWINRPGGNNDTYHGGQSLGFDTENTSNWEFGHSFTNLPQITGATLTIGVRSTGSSGNDRVNLQFDDVTHSYSWGSQFAPLETLVGGDGVWSNGDSMTVTLDLAALPGGVVTNLIPSINATGHLDVRIADDTDIDFVELSYCEVTAPGPVFAGNSHSQLGSATLVTIPGGLQVSNIGHDGLDGVLIDSNPSSNPFQGFYSQFKLPQSISAGAQLSMPSMGTAPGGQSVMLGNLQANWQVGGAVQYAASFPQTDGWMEQKLQIYKAGELVWEGTGMEPTAIINLDGCWSSEHWELQYFNGKDGLGWYKVYFIKWDCPDGLGIVPNMWYAAPGSGGPGTPPVILGDEIRFSPVDSTMPEGIPTSTAFKAKDISSFTLEEEGAHSPTHAPVNLGGGATPACGGGCSSMELIATGGPSIAGNASFGLEVVETPDTGFVGMRIGIGAATPGFPLAGGTWYVPSLNFKYPLLPVAGMAGCSGSAFFPLRIPNDPELIGFELTVQGFFLCPSGAAVPTNALSVTIQ